MARFNEYLFLDLTWQVLLALLALMECHCCNANIAIITKAEIKWSEKLSEKICR